jgi:hypothetical protein
MSVTEGSFEDRLFGGLVPGRACGACTACCFEITIDDLQMQKPPRQTCMHCVSAGCAIYADRPGDCRTWFCAWRRIADLPDHLSPDRCGLLACLVENHGAENPLQRLYLIVQWLGAQPIVKSEAADQLLAALRRYGLPGWVGSGDRMSLHFPRQAVALAVMNGSVPTGPLAAEVEAWRRRLPPRRGT